MYLPFHIARRIRASQADDGHRRNPGVVIAVAGVALAVVVMELTLAIVTGFRQGITERVSGFMAPVTVNGAFNPVTQSTDQLLRLTPDLAAVIEENTPSGAYTEIEMHLPAILKTDDDYATIVLRGRQGTADGFAFEKGNMVEGSWPDYGVDPEADNMIVISRPTADALGLHPGDKITAAVIHDDAMRLRKPTVAGIFRSDFGDYDRAVAYASLSMLQSLVRADSLTASSVSIKGIDLDRAPEVAEGLQQAIIDAAAQRRIDGVFTVDNVHRSAASYFSWLDLLDTNVVVVFTLISIVAAFTLVSSLFIILMERIRMIGLLRALGMARSGIRSIFLVMAGKIVLAGMVAGNILGLGIILSQQMWHWIPLNPEMYYLTSVPMEPVWWHIVVLNAAIPVVAWLVLILPASLVARVKPAAVMRYE